MRTRCPLALGALAVSMAGVPRPSYATPQITSDVGVGGGVQLAPGGASGVFSLALRADVLFGGDSPYAFRLGPYASVRSDNFHDLAPSVGVSALLPVTSTFPLVLSAGAVVDVASPTDRAGGLARLWWGGRSYNYHSPYGLTVGVWVEARYFPASTGTADVVGGVDVDLEVFALPLIFLYNWIAH